MLFNSYIFVFLFFPICLAGYYGLLHLQKKEAAGIFLTAMSFWFYGYFNVAYLFIIIASILNFFLFLWKGRDQWLKRNESLRNAPKNKMNACILHLLRDKHLS